MCGGGGGDGGGECVISFDDVGCDPKRERGRGGGGRDAFRMRKTVRIGYKASIADMPLIAQRPRIKAYKVGAFDLTG